MKGRSRDKGAGKSQSSTGPTPASELPELTASIEALCKLIQRHTGHDFSNYKEATLLRRIRRRLQALHVTAVADYVQLLESSATEAETLVKDLLIGDTQFFRDPETFDLLSRQILPRLTEAKGEQAPLRIWVPGCASGEEAYTIAMSCASTSLGADRSSWSSFSPLTSMLECWPKLGRDAMHPRSASR